MSPEHVKTWLLEAQKKTPADWTIIEFGGRRHWPAKLQRLGGKGEWSSTDVTLRTLDFKDLAAARQDAEQVFEDLGFGRRDDRTAFEAAKVAHSELWNELDTYAQVAKGLRTNEGQFAQLMLLENLIDSAAGKVDRAEVFNIFGQLQFFAKLEDPRIEDIDQPTLIALVMKIDEVRHLGPLVGIGLPATDSFVTSMAVLLASYLRSEPSSPSTASSTPARSRTKP